LKIGIDLNNIITKEIILIITITKVLFQLIVTKRIPIVCFMREKDIVETIKRLGITEYEAKVYLALIKNGRSTAGELTLLSGVPHSRIYGVLQTLEAKNWVIKEGVSSRGGKAAKYKAKPPEETLKVYFNEFSESVVDATSTLQNLFDQKSSTEKFEFWTLRGEDVYRTMNKIMKAAKFVVLVLQVEPALTLYVNKIFETLQKSQSDLEELLLLTDLDQIYEIFGLDFAKKICRNFKVVHASLRPFPLPFVSVLNVDFERVLVVFPTVATVSDEFTLMDVVGAYLEIPGFPVTRAFAERFDQKMKGFKSGQEWLKELQGGR